MFDTRASFNAILLHDSLPAQDCTDWMIVVHFVFPSIFDTPLKINPRSFF